ncbi:MAG TPA: family 2 glycosyl transferase [Planctomycetaceae bacterium]|nr:family 2 glycosyl transferase [Planctomycetaceae bacterium]
MKISLIITTYNWKEALGLCLQTVLEQTRLPDEIIIADDGSREDTAALIGAYRQKSPIPVIHSWQPDEGFRLATSRNRGIARSCGEYIIMIDGDLLLHRKFCEDHLRNATPGFWVQGTRTHLTPEKSGEIFRTGDTRIGFWGGGVTRRKNTIYFPLLSRFWKGNQKSVNGSNLAFWRADVLAVNGFNEAFVGWGAEDVEFIARMTHRGIRRRNIRFQALSYHLYHEERSREMLEVNRAILEETRRTESLRCAKGIDAYLDERECDAV